MYARSIIDMTNLQAAGVPQLSRELRVTPVIDPQGGGAINAVRTETYPPETDGQNATCRMTEADLNAARRAAKRAALPKAYALQAGMDSDGVVSLIATPTDPDSRRPVFLVRRPRPGVVSIARLGQAAFEDLGELGTMTEAIRMVCHHARYRQAGTIVEA